MLHPRVLYEAMHETAYTLAIIFNKLFESKQLPLDWRSAIISAIYMKGSKQLHLITDL